MRVDIWSDVVCPWCYVGKRRFERALAGFPHADQLEVVHRSFQLNPAAPKGETSDRKRMLMSKYGWTEAQAQQMDARMQQTFAAEGIEFRSEGTLTGNTADAHQLLHLARAQGLQDRVLDRFYRAYFSEQRSVFDRESLIALAAEAGLDADAARQVLEGGTYAEAVAADVAEARQLGADGVPFYVIAGRYGISGAQGADVFLRALTQAWNER